MKRTSWEWSNSNRKKAAQIMWDTQGQDYDTVCALIGEACGLNRLNSRNLYRKLCREEMIEQGFVPAPIKVGRPPKNASAAPSPVAQSYAAVKAAPAPEPVYIEPEPEPERTATGERKSISDMKAYLEQLKRKANG